MELERLEVILEVNTQKFQDSMKKIQPQIDSMFNRIEQSTSRNKTSLENNMDMTGMTKNLETTLNNFTNTFSKQMDRLEETSKKKVTSTSRNFEQGFKKTRTTAGKEIDLMVKDINAKMGQARAAQNRIAQLTAQRTASVRDNDPNAAVRYDEQIANAEARMTSYRNKATEMARAMKAEFDAVPSSLDNISATMEANEVRIEAMRGKLADMQNQYESQRQVSGSFTEGGFTTSDSPESRDTMLKIQGQAEKMNKLVRSNDALQQAYATTESRAQMLRQAIGGLGENLSKSSIQTGNAAQGIQTVASVADRARGAWSKFGGVFNRTSNFIAHGARRARSATGDFFGRFNRGASSATRNTNRMGRSTNMLSRTISQLGRRIFIYGILYRGIMALGKGMFSALKTNEQFANSLNQIQVNLMTAFYPIYQAVLPAINALMEALARVTGYIAAFVATLFGTTYTAAKKGAQGLYENAKAMDDTGSGATKAKEKVNELKRSLMGFDEINRIGLDVNSDADDSLDSGNSGPKNQGIDFGGATGNYTTPAWLTNFANKVKDILSRLFAPMRAAWDKHGQAVMDAFKYALNESWELVKSIGRSFMEVWENGTGEEFIGNILQLLATVLNIIGDIARAFRIAWDDEGRGTALIQSIFDMWNSILVLLRVIGETFRTVWNDGTGVRIAGHILEIYTNVFSTISELADRFTEAWSAASNGERIFGVILGVVEKILETVNNITGATREWAENLNLEPLLSSVAGMLENIEPIIANALDGLSWLYTNVLLPIAKWAIESALPPAIDAISAAFGILEGVVSAVTPMLSWLWEKVLQPIGRWTGGLIVSVLEKIGEVLTIVGDWIAKNQKPVSDFIAIVGVFAGTLAIIAGLGKVVSIISGIAAGFSILGGLSGILGLLVGAVKGVITILGGPWALALAGAVAVGVGLWRNWDTIKEKASELGSRISTKWGEIKENTKTTWGDIKDKVSENSSTAWDNVKESFGNIKKNITGNSKDSNKVASLEFGDMEVNASSAFGGIWNVVKKVFPGVNKDITDNSSKANKNGSGSFKTLKDNAGTYFGSIWSDTKTKFDNVASRISTKTEDARRSGVNAFSRMKSGMSGYLTDIQTKTSDVFNKVTSWASGLGEKIGSGLRNGINAVKRGSASIANGIMGTIGKAVNGVINGINWILRKVGAGKSTLDNWSVPQYAQGTDSHPGGLAMVNDGPGSKFREAYEVNGKVGLFPNQRNMLVDLPKGAKVLDGKRTDAMYGHIPHYAGGIGNWLSKTWDGAKNMAGTVWDYVTNPNKLLEAAISKFVNLSGVMQPQLNMAKGAISTVSAGATSFVKKFLEQGQEEMISTGSGGGVNFKGLRQTSPFGYRVHPIYGTRRLHAGVDYGGGQGIGHPIHSQSGGIVTQAGPSGSGYGTTVRIRQGIIEHLYAHLNRTLTSVGKNIKRGDLIGQMGNTGASTGPHVHYEVRKRGTPINPLGSYENGGMVSNEGYYRLAEGNKKELIIPLERRNRALELLDIAKDYLGVNDMQTLQMPEAMLTTPTSRFSSPTATREFGGGGLSGMSSTLEMLISTLMSSESSGTENLEVTLEVDRTNLGKVVIKEINKVIDTTGNIPIDI